jgi:protein gp37
MAKRLKAMGHPNYINEFKVTCHEHVLELPLRWQKPKMVFTNSMSDLFHRDVPYLFIQKVFKTMNRARWHCFQILTKRPGRMLKISNALNWTSNIWLGVTVENKRFQSRILELQEAPASVKFLSLEPLLGPIPNLQLKGIDWVIVGGESGPGAREMKKHWVADVRDKCLAVDVPFFFKQWGGVNKKKTGRLLDNKLWNQIPAVNLMSTKQWSLDGFEESDVS